MRYFQLINSVSKQQYPVVAVKELYYEDENRNQILFAKRNIIANFPNETVEIAHDLSFLDVQRELSYSDTEIIVPFDPLFNQGMNILNIFTVETTNRIIVVTVKTVLTDEHKEFLKNTYGEILMIYDGTIGNVTKVINLH